MAAMEQQGSGEGDSGSDTGGGWWFKRFRRRVGQWAYAEAEERLPMLRQRGDGTGSPNCQQEERASLLLRRADPGTYVSPRACAALLRQQQETRSLPRSLPEAYHSIAVPRAARPGQCLLE